MLYPAELPGLTPDKTGAGRENRTLISSLEGWHTKPLYDTRVNSEDIGIIPDYRSNFELLQLVEDSNAGAKAVEPLGQVFVAALDGIDIAQCRHAIGGQHAD